MLNFVVSDGFALLATRYVYPTTEPAASLYYSEGSAFQRSNGSVVERQTEANSETLLPKQSIDGATTARHSSVSGLILRTFLHQSSCDTVFPNANF